MTMAMDKTQRITNLLSMAQRAGRIVSGAFATEKAVKEHKACLLLVAADASEETKRSYQILADRYAIPYQEVLTREELGGCLGKAYRAVAALLDEGFAKKLGTLVADGGIMKQ